MPLIDYGGWYYLGTYQGMDIDYSHQLLSTTPKFIAVDIETISLKDRTIIGIGISISPEHGWYFSWLKEGGLEEFPWNLMENPSVIKIMHNSMFDAPEIWQQCGHRPIWPILDSMIACTTFGLPGKLKTLAAALDLEKDDGSEIQDIEDVLPKGKTMLDIPEVITAEKCIWDVRTTHKLLLTILPEMDLDPYMEEMESIPILIVAQGQGLALDQREVNRWYLDLNQKIKFFRDYCEEEYSANPGSSEQMAYILGLRAEEYPDTFEHLRLKRRDKLLSEAMQQKASFTLDKTTLKKMSDPLAAMVLSYRSVQKQMGYVSPLRGLDRVYTHYHLLAATTRISSYKVGPEEIQALNVPKHLRGMFLPDSGVFTSFDNSQQELRILQYLSSDVAMGEVFSQATNLQHQCTNGQTKCEQCDIHLYTALAMGVSRDPAKNTGYAMIYGGSDETIAETAGVPDLRLAHDLGIAWGNTFPQAMEYIMYSKDKAMQDGYVTTIGGRRIYLKEPDPDNPGEVAAVERTAVNYPIQGSGADVIKRQMRKVWGYGWNFKIPIHDELVMDGRYDIESKREELENVVPGMTVPIDVKYSATWA